MAPFKKRNLAGMIYTSNIHAKIQKMDFNNLLDEGGAIRLKTDIMVFSILVYDFLAVDYGEGVI